MFVITATSCTIESYNKKGLPQKATLLHNISKNLITNEKSKYSHFLTCLLVFLGLFFSSSISESSSDALESSDSESSDSSVSVTSFSG